MSLSLLLLSKFGVKSMMGSFILNKKVVDNLYKSAIVEQDEDTKIQLITWAADLGNSNAISYIHNNLSIITDFMAERMDESTYYFFEERENKIKNMYSLYMLGLVNGVTNNPHTYLQNKTRKIDEDKLEIEYYEKSAAKGNPLAMIDLAMIYNHKKKKFSDKTNEIINLVRKANELNCSIPVSLQKYL